jgi:RimJ/RimL family protein N-acetyltransferase
MSFPPWESLGLSNLFLRNDDISNLPELHIPVGYLLLSNDLPESEHVQLADCLSKAFGIQHGAWDASRIPKEFIDEKTVKKTFRLIHEESGVIVATASLRVIPDKYPGSAYLHWVAVHPAHQGRGLGYVVSVAVLREGRDEHGLTSCVLETQDTSLPAIVTYEKLGFHAVNTDDTHAARWEAVRAALTKK